MGARLNKPSRVSVVVPVLNEQDSIRDMLLQPALQDTEVELIVVDGGSTDETLSEISRLSSADIKVLSSDPGRAIQMNLGAQEASGDIILFLHADTYLPQSFIDHLSLFTSKDEVWGRFDVALDSGRLPFKVISWFMNWRSRLTGIATGDQAIFVQASVFRNLGGFKCQPLMEDIELSGRLKKVSRPYCIKNKVLTSSRKWQKEGVIRTVLLMWKLRLAYYCGETPDKLVKKYYHSSS